MGRFPASFAKEKNMTPSFRDSLLDWLQEQKNAVKLAREIEKEADVRNVLSGALDAYSNVLAYILTEGKLR